MVDDKQDDTAREVRDRVRRIPVGVSPSERKAIEARAAAANLSVSAYLRTAGLNHPIRSSFDHDAVLTLGKLHGELARTGGLLKQWLDTKPGEGATATSIEALRADLTRLAAKLGAEIDRLAP